MTKYVCSAGMLFLWLIGNSLLDRVCGSELPLTIAGLSKVKANEELAQFYLLHWVHVPKAGGTALARTLKKVICKINPVLTAYNPCCRASLCLHSNSCHAAVGGCPLLTATGRHSSNMAFSTSMICCPNDLVTSITASFVPFSFPQTKTLLSDESGAASSKIWPLVDRASFLLATGVSRATLHRHIEKKSYPSEIQNISTGSLLSIAAAKVGFKFVESVQPQRQGRLALCSASSRIKDWRRVGETSEVPTVCSRLAPRGSQSTAKEETSSAVGDFSITILRHPFQRAVSACMYKGHSPNYDVFGLRPGLWIHPAEKPPGYRTFNFHDYVRAEEYQNSLVKLFGDSRGCVQGRKCDAVADREDRDELPPLNRKTVACTLANQCHAYRNASYLSQEHLNVASRTLKRFKFFGLQEAYNTSVMLLAKTFDMESMLDMTDFAKERHTNPEEAYACKGYSRRGLIYDPKVCRAVMDANYLDVQFFEAAHREFCSRLKLYGLWTNKFVQQEIQDAQLCGALDWSSKDDFCAQFDTPEWTERRQRDRDKCIRHHPGMVRFRGGLGGTTLNPNDPTI